jgi:glyoxylase-like metal-dependent hydrolase (beta-lactamase superfamily II)
VKHGDNFMIGNMPVEVIATPGHARGHVCYHLPEQKVLLGGDLILGHAIGRVDLPGGDLPTLLDSLRRVMQLPDDTVLLPGHGEPSTLADERRLNPYVRQALG